MRQVHTRRLMIRDGVLWTEIQGESVLLDVESGLYFGLNAVGTEIWRMLSQGADGDGILTGLLARFDVEPARLRADVAEFLGVLEARGLARVTDHLETR